MELKVTCIDAKNKPNDIKNSNWLIKGQEYTAIALKRMVTQKNDKCFVLEEVKPDAPYIGYWIWRFAPIDFDLFILQNKDEISDVDMEFLKFWNAVQKKVLESIEIESL